MCLISNLEPLKIVKMADFTNFEGPKFQIWRKLAFQSHQRKRLLRFKIFYVKTRTFKGCEAHFLFQTSRKFQKNQLIILGEESSLLSRHRIKNREIRLRFGTKNPRNWKFVDEMIWQNFWQYLWLIRTKIQTIFTILFEFQPFSQAENNIFEDLNLKTSTKRQKITKI